MNDFAATFGASMPNDGAGFERGRAEILEQGHAAVIGAEDEVAVNDGGGNINKNISDNTQSVDDDDELRLTANDTLDSNHGSDHDEADNVVGERLGGNSRRRRRSSLPSRSSGLSHRVSTMNVLLEHYSLF